MGQSQGSEGYEIICICRYHGLQSKNLAFDVICMTESSVFETRYFVKDMGLSVPVVNSNTCMYNY